MQCVGCEHLTTSSYNRWYKVRQIHAFAPISERTVHMLQQILRLRPGNIFPILCCPVLVSEHANGSVPCSQLTGLSVSAAVTPLLQGSVCCAFRDDLLSYLGFNEWPFELPLPRLSQTSVLIRLCLLASPRKTDALWVFSLVQTVLCKHRRCFCIQSHVNLTSSPLMVVLFWIFVNEQLNRCTFLS